MTQCLKSSLLEIQVSINLGFHQLLGIGKSCVLKRLVENEFKEDHDVTVGVEFGSYLVRV
jgi:GTPase SAR1 family protein